MHCPSCKKSTAPRSEHGDAWCCWYCGKLWVIEARELREDEIEAMPPDMRRSVDNSRTVQPLLRRSFDEAERDFARSSHFVL